MLDGRGVVRLEGSCLSTTPNRKVKLRMYIPMSLIVTLCLLWFFRDWIRNALVMALDLAAGLTRPLLDWVVDRGKRKRAERAEAHRAFVNRDQAKDFKGLQGHQLAIFGVGFVVVGVIGYLVQN